MLHKYLLMLLSLAVLLGSCQDDSAARSVTPPMYAVAYTWPVEHSSWVLALSDGVVPNPLLTGLLGADGKIRRFADEAAILNYLYGLGWDILPNGFTGGNHVYILKRRTP